MILHRRTFSKQGFTLIELVVVTTIILVLFVVATVSFAGANQKARDSRRLTDLSRIQSALELYRQGVGTSYPDSLDVLVSPSVGLMSTLPADPKPATQAYYYLRTGNGYTYNLGARMELGNLPDIIDGCGAVDVGRLNCNYMITNP